MTSKASFLLTSAILSAIASNLSAATFTWDGKATGGNLHNWNASQNWTGPVGTPGAADLAVFNTVTAGRSVTPTLTAASPIGTIQFSAGGQALPIGGAFALTINAIGGVGIQNDNATLAEAINTSSVVLGAAQTWNNAGTLNIGAAGLSLGANALTVAGAGATTISSLITGTAGITQTGGGSLTLSGANTYSGASTISGGTLGFSGSGRLGSGGTILNGGALTVSSDAQLGTAGNLTFGGGNLQTGAGITSSRSVTLNAGGGTIGVSGASLFSGNFTGVGGLTKTGNGTLSLSGNNSYSALNVSGGTLDAQTASSLGSPSTAINIGSGTLSIASTPSVGAITLGSGATLNQGTSAATFGALSVIGNSTINLGLAAGSLTFALAGPSSGVLTINHWQGPAYDPNNLNQGNATVKIFITGSADSGFLSNVQFNGEVNSYPQGAAMFNGELVPVPEPQVYAVIFAAGLLGFAMIRRRTMAVA